MDQKPAPKAPQNAALPDPALEALWKNVLHRWDDNQAHGAFLKYCQASGQLVEAAVRYRGMTGDHERKDAAGKRLAGVAALAMAELERERATPSQVKRQTTSLVLIVLFVAASLALLIYLANPK